MIITESRLHFIGVGGIGMCGLAELLQSMGANVSGSDLAENKQTKNLETKGVRVIKGHLAENITDDIDVVVYSSAIKASNIEYLQARKLKIPLIPRAEALSEIMLLKKGIAVAGTHGKTTTTSIISSLFLEAGVDPTIFVGGIVERIKSTAQLGKGEWLIAEADESDGSFLKLSPQISIITNIDDDHLDFYGSYEEIQKSFYNFALKVPFYGRVIVYGDDPRIRELFIDFPKKILFYGMQEINDYSLKKTIKVYEVYRGREYLGNFVPPLPGDHNALNSLAALISGLEVGFDFNTCVKGVESFSGVARRSQYKGERGGVIIYDDYAHHPTELIAVLKAFREIHEGRLVALFEPHRYSRTKDCWQGFLNSFSEVDQLIMIDIYSAGESPIEGVTAQDLLKSISVKEKYYIPLLTGNVQDPKDLYRDHSEALDRIKKILKPGDLVLTLGAGKVYRIGEALLLDEAKYDSEQCV